MYNIDWNEMSSGNALKKMKVKLLLLDSWCTWLIMFILKPHKQNMFPDVLQGPAA